MIDILSFLVFIQQICMQYHSVQYPTLLQIVKDYLAIQRLAVPSEQAFSDGEVTGISCHSSLKPKTFEALQFWRGHIITAMFWQLSKLSWLSYPSGGLLTNVAATKSRLFRILDATGSILGQIFRTRAQIEGIHVGYRKEKELYKLMSYSRSYFK